MKILWKLYWVFAQLGAVCFGGGYAMLSLLQQVIVDKYHWATDEELLDYYAVGQCTPGIIAINTSTFIGYKLAKIPGAIAAGLGFLTPSVVIIIVIAMFLENFAHIPVVVHAFAGIRVCVCVLILDAVLKLGVKSVTGLSAWAIFLVTVFLSFFTEISTVLLVIAAGIAGYVLYILRRAGK